MSQYSAGSSYASNLGARACGRASSTDWHDEYNRKHLDASEYDPSSFFASPTKLLLASPPPPPKPPAPLGSGNAYGFGLGLGNDAAPVPGPGGSSAAGGGTAAGASMAAAATTTSLGPGVFGWSLGTGMGAGAATGTATDLGGNFGTLPSASFGPGGGLGFASGPYDLGFSNGNGFNSTGISNGANIGGGPSPYGYPPMPTLGSGPIVGPSTVERWFDQSGATLQLSPSDYTSQYAFQDAFRVDGDPAAAAAVPDVPDASSERDV